MAVNLGTGTEAPHALPTQRATRAWAFVAAAASVILLLAVGLAWTGSQPTERASTRTIPDVEIDTPQSESPVTATGFRPMLRSVVPAEAPAARTDEGAEQPAPGAGRGDGGGGGSERPAGAGPGGGGGTNGGGATDGGGSTGDGGTGTPPPQGGGTTGPGNSTNGNSNGNGTGNGTPEPGQGIPVVNMPPTAVGPVTTPGVSVALFVGSKGSVDVETDVGDTLVGDLPGD